MLFHKRISLLIPCRNEELALASLLKKVPTYIDEIIVVDNKSTDSTTRVAKAYGARVFYDSRTVNGIGYGFAHRTGMKNATGDYIVAMDGDDTYPTHSIKTIIIMMEGKKLDFVVCNRFPLSNNQAITPIRQLGITVLNLIILVLYGCYLTDSLTGMWVTKKKVINQLNIRSGDWNFSPEIKLAALINKNINFGQYHIPYFMRKGDSKQDIWRTGLKHALFIIKYRLYNISIRTFFIDFAKNIASLFI